MVLFTRFQWNELLLRITRWHLVESVSTRGESNLKFSVLILYIISSSLNSRVIYDDAYLIQAKEPYPSFELKLFVERYIQDLYSINDTNPVLCRDRP